MENAAAEMLGVLEVVEWIYSWGNSYCPWCGESKMVGHDENCPRQLAIAKVKGEENESA